MSRDFVRDLQKIGRNLSGLDPGDVGLRNLTPRTCFVVVSQRRLADVSGFYDGLKAARVFLRADFRLFFIVNPEYADLYAWLTFFLESVKEYLALVLTGFPVTNPDGSAGDGHPFVIKSREVPPSRLYKLITEFKNSDSRLTIIVNGCPAVESWSNAGMESQKLLFSTTSVTYVPTQIRAFQGQLPERMLLVTVAPRLDIAVRDRAKNGAANFLCEISKALKADPVLDLEGLVAVVSPNMRLYGEEIVAYASSVDVQTGTPFLL
jgi:hypothetical protein